MLPTLGLFSQGGSDLGREQTPVPQLSLEEKAPSSLTIVRRDREEKKRAFADSKQMAGAEDSLGEGTGNSMAAGCVCST